MTTSTTSRRARRSRLKGSEGEREVVRLHTAMGVHAERVPLSSAMAYQDNPNMSGAVKAHKLLLSAIAALEVALDVDRDAYAGEAKAPRWLDPHLVGEIA